MVYKKLNSKAKNTKEIPWNKEIEVSQIVFDEIDFNKFNELYLKNKSPKEKEILINNFLVKQMVFEKAFETIVECYEFKIDDGDFKMIKQFEINKYNFDESSHDSKKQQFIQFKQNEKDTYFNKNKEIFLKRMLIFIDLAKKNNITIDENEFNQYVKSLEENNIFNNSQILDKQKIYWMMFESKMQAFIVNKFKFNIEKLKTNIQYDYKHIYKNVEKIDSYTKSLVSKKLPTNDKI